MTRMFVVSNQYLPLVNVIVSGFSSPISRKVVSTDDLKSTFISSSRDLLLTCSSEEDAKVVMRCLLKKPSSPLSSGDFHPQAYAVPVIYAIDIDETKLPGETRLTVDDLVDYANECGIPLYCESAGKRSVEEDYINTELREQRREIKVRKLGQLSIDMVRAAIYLTTDAITLQRVDLTPRWTLGRVVANWAINFFRLSTQSPGPDHDANAEAFLKITPPSLDIKS